LRGSLERYLNHGINPGGFLTAVLENDLSGAVMRADYVNKHYLVDIASFVFSRMPAASAGRVGAMDYWRDHLANSTEAQS